MKRQKFNAKKLNKVKRENLEQLIQDTHGELFRLSFIKRSTGLRRDMMAMTEVQVDIKGVGMSYDRKSKNLCVLFDTEKGAYRAVPLETIFELEIGNKVYVVEE